MFTNDRKEYERVVAWREAAIADGWSCQATYEGGEAMERAASLRHPNGYYAMILSRDDTDSLKNKKYKFEVGVYLWDAPGSGIDIPAPATYSMEGIQRSERTCPECNKEYESASVMVRVAFANRCCPECAPALRAKLETSGWCE